MNQTDFHDFTTVSTPIRVRWLEVYEGPTHAPVRRERTWAGLSHSGDPLWCDHNGDASVRESFEIQRGTTHDGTVIGFRDGTLLIEGDYDRIIILPVNQVRRLK